MNPDVTLDALFNLWWSTSIVAIVAIWWFALPTYDGRHRLEDLGPQLYAWAEVEHYIDVLTTPIHTCALPPVAEPAVYHELGPVRFMAAKESMHRREAQLRAARYPTGALVTVSPWGTPAEVADEWVGSNELVGVAS